MKKRVADKIHKVMLVICENAKECKAKFRFAKNGCMHHIPHEPIPYAGASYSCTTIPCRDQYYCVAKRCVNQ